MENKQPKRIGYVDGIKGIASIFIIFCHLAYVFLPGLFSYSRAISDFEKIWINSPLHILTGGNAAVQCFFVLSGFLIAMKMYNKRSAGIASPFKLYGKLLRLVVPAVIFSALLMACGLMYHMRALELNQALGFVSNKNNFTVTIGNVLYDAFLRTFLSKSNFVGPFWTIPFEFAGTILISAVSYYACGNKNSKWIYIFCFIFCALFCSENFFAFIFGAFVYDCIFIKSEEHQSWIDKAATWILQKRVLLIFALLAGFYFACINNSVTGIWSPLKNVPYIDHLVVAIRSFGIAVCLLCTIKIGVLQRFFSLKPLRWLGHISAYTYAFHWPIILSLGCGLYVLLHGRMPEAVVITVISVSVLVSSLLLSWSYMKVQPHLQKLETALWNKTKQIPVFAKKQKKRDCD